MQIIRKLSRTNGGSYVLFIPKRWVENLEKIKGQKISKIQMTLNGSILCEAIFEDGTVLLKKQVRKKILQRDNEREKLLSEMEVC